MFRLNPHYLNARPYNGTVRPYNPSTDWEEVSVIARENLDRLVSVDRGADREQLLNNYIQPALQPETCQVVVQNGRCQGFISFGVKNQWGRVNVGFIDLLAVAKTGQKNGSGRELMDYALNRLYKEQNAHFVSVQITALSLIFYYRKFGFKPVLLWPSTSSLLAIPPNLPIKQRLWSIGLGLAHSYKELLLASRSSVPGLLFLWVDPPQRPQDERATSV